MIHSSRDDTDGNMIPGNLKKITSLERKHKQPFENGWMMMKTFQRRNTMGQRLKREWVLHWKYNEQSKRKWQNIEEENMPTEIKIQEEQQQYILSTSVSQAIWNLDLHYLGNRAGQVAHRLRVGLEHQL